MKSKTYLSRLFASVKDYLAEEGKEGLADYFKRNAGRAIFYIVFAAAVFQTGKLVGTLNLYTESMRLQSYSDKLIDAQRRTIKNLEDANRILINSLDKRLREAPKESLQEFRRIEQEI